MRPLLVAALIVLLALSACTSLHHRAERGDPTAQFNLGVLYYEGREKKQDYTEALKWFRKAAETKPEPVYQFAVGNLYDNGYGVQQNFIEAEKWYLQSAEQGYAPAQFNLGILYSTDRVKLPGEWDTNRKEAFRWYLAAAEQGLVDAQYAVIDAYFQARGVKQNKSEAAKWLRKLSEQGNADAQNNLGYLYRVGDGVSKDGIEAVKWFRMAAEQGHALAQLNLGWMYADGEGVSQDFETAYFWLLLALDNNAKTEKTGIKKQIDSYWPISGDVEFQIRKALPHLTPNEVSAVKQRVKEWKPHRVVSLKDAWRKDHPIKLIK